MTICQKLKHKLFKIFKNLKRSLLFWKRVSASEKFIRSNDNTHIKYVEAEFWQQNEIYWIYFMYLNLPVMITLFYGGYQMIFIDIVFIFFVSKIHY